MAFFSSLAAVLPAAATPASSLPPRRGSYRAAPVLLRVSSGKRRVSSFPRAATTSLSVRCEQSSKQGGGGSVVDVWASRLAMMSFAAAVVAEVSTGKGLVENFGVATPAPALALVVTALVVGLAVLFIVRSGSQD